MHWIVEDKNIMKKSENEAREVVKGGLEAGVCALGVPRAQLR